MYQPLIWAKFLRHEAGRLRAALDAERLESKAHSLVDGVGRNSELDRNFLGRKMLIDEAEAIELALGKPGYRTSARLGPLFSDLILGRHLLTLISVRQR